MERHLRVVLLGDRETVHLDLDKNGNLVSMTIEHAAATAKLPQISLEEIGASAA